MTKSEAQSVCRFDKTVSGGRYLVTLYKKYSCVRTSTPTAKSVTREEY